MRKESCMTVAFRVDASLEIGTGHVMRCLTLGDALREHGAECHFICREHIGHLCKFIRQCGFEVSVLPQCNTGYIQAEGEAAPQPSHASWLGCDWLTDSRQTGGIIRGLKPDWLVLDHYALDHRWEEELQGQYGKLMVIDDLADRAHTCDLLLNQNLGRNVDDYAHLVPDHCTILVGPQYALLRPEFTRLREYSLRRRTKSAIRRLLITMGGVDQPNATGQVLNALKTCPLPEDCEITVIMGGQAPWLSRVSEIAATMPWPTEVRVNISDMAQLMSDSDLAIGAAGSTSWERCCLGLPTILVVLAENQQPIADALDVSGAAISLGNILEQDFSKKFNDSMEKLLADAGLLSTISTIAAGMVDGAGAKELSCIMKGRE